MNNLSKKTGGIAAGVSALTIGLGLLGVAPVEASLIGDEVTLDLEFSSESDAEFEVLTDISTEFGEGAPFVEDGPASNIVEENGSFLDGPFTGTPEFFAAGTAFTEGFFGEGGFGEGFFGEGSVSSSFGVFNVEGEFIEGDLGVFWSLFGEAVAPFSWEYTFSDLDWTDFPDGQIVGASLSFAEGFGFAEVFSGFAEGAGLVDYESLFALDFTEDSVTIALDVDPFGFGEGVMPAASVENGFGEGFVSAFGFAEGFFRVDLEVEHEDDAVDVPEPTSAIGLLLMGGLGLTPLARRSKSARRRDS